MIFYRWLLIPYTKVLKNGLDEEEGITVFTKDIEQAQYWFTTTRAAALEKGYNVHTLYLAEICAKRVKEQIVDEEIVYGYLIDEEDIVDVRIVGSAEGVDEVPELLK